MGGFTAPSGAHLIATAPTVTIAPPTVEWAGSFTPPFVGSLDAVAPTVTIAAATMEWSGTTGAHAGPTLRARIDGETVTFARIAARVNGATVPIARIAVRQDGTTSARHSPRSPPGRSLTGGTRLALA